MGKVGKNVLLLFEPYGTYKIWVEEIYFMYVLTWVQNIFGALFFVLPASLVGESYFEYESDH